jgi:hypothetical protein
MAESAKGAEWLNFGTKTTSTGPEERGLFTAMELISICLFSIQQKVIML